MDRDEFFVQLDQLTPQEIEARLSSWSTEQLRWAQEYLARYSEPPPDQVARAATDAARAATEIAMRANARSTIAIIIAVGAMLAAIASAVALFVALGNF
jgi:hypothetical protein